MSAKPNYRLPPDDHLVAPRVQRRTKRAVVDACSAMFLSRDWSLMGAADRREALKVARIFGAEFAKVHADAADRDSYVNTCAWWAFNDMKVINDVEFALWESVTSDPRIDAFAEGCAAYRAKRLKKAS